MEGRYVSAVLQGGATSRDHPLEQDGLQLLLALEPLRILEPCPWVLAPQLLQPANLRERDLTRAELLVLARLLDEPREERAVVDDCAPLGRVPDNVLGRGERRAGLPAEEDDDRVGLCGDEAEQEDVFAAAVVACRTGIRVLLSAARPATLISYGGTHTRAPSPPARSRGGA